MAKRKKSKKQPKSEQVAVAPATESIESAAPAEAAAESLTADPPVAQAPNPAVAEEISTQAGQAEPTGEAVELEADRPAPSAEDGVAPNADSPPADETAAPTVTDEVPTAEQDESAASAPNEATESTTSTADGEISEFAPPAPGDRDETDETLAESRLESILESLLFASDKPLGLAELKRLLGERDGKKVTAAVDALVERRKGTGIEVAALSSGWHLRTNPENQAWVAKLLVGRPVRLSRAMLETLAIVAYRQPVTRPEVDDIRGVDCGPVLRTLLDRSLVRIIGKKEEVGRPMLYGTTSEFLRIFNLRDLSELPTLREFCDLSSEDQSRVEAEHGPEPEAQSPSATAPKPDVALTSLSRGALEPEAEETDPLLDELDEASQLAKQALGGLEPAAPDEGASEVSGVGRGGAGPEVPEGVGGGVGAGPEAPEGRAVENKAGAGTKDIEEPPASQPPASE